MKKVLTVYIQEREDFPSRIVLQAHRNLKELPYKMEKREFTDALWDLVEEEIENIY